MPGGGSAALDPVGNPQAWDTVTVAGMKSPGLIPKGGLRCPRKFKWDTKEGKGAQGGTSTFVGRPLPDGSLKLQFWLTAHFLEWSFFLPLLKYDPTKRAPSAVDIYHPSLADLDISSIVVDEIGNIEHAGDGLYEVEVKFHEYSPPPKASAVSTPTKSKDGPDPFDQAAAGLSTLGQKVQDRLKYTTGLINQLTKP